jgi:hypothetical protein
MAASRLQEHVTTEAVRIIAACKQTGCSLKQHLSNAPFHLFPNPYCKDSRPQLIDFELAHHQLLFWYPQHFYGLPNIFCPCCGEGKVAKSGWVQSARPVKCLNHGCTWILTRRYTCSTCHRGFAASDPECLQMLQMLPEFVQLQFPASLRSRCVALQQAWR